MRLQLFPFDLDTAGDALLLKILSGGELSDRTAGALLAHVREAGASFVLIESPYVDLDYSADYQAFYAGAFKEHSRTTQRLHFFAEDISPLLGDGLSTSNCERMQAAYLGFVVVRPIPHGPIGRSMLTFPNITRGTLTRPTVRATARVNLVGFELTVTGAPFIQQEAKVGACAQATIWMASLFMHMRHHKRRYTMAEITRFAVTPADASLSLALPAGSAGLQPAHMVRALTGMGFQPLFDLFDEGKVKSRPPSVDAAQAIIRYLDSGMPVILLLHCISHAVTGVGFLEATGARHGETGGFDDRISALIVHDDQRGPYRLLPLRAGDVAGLPDDRLMRDDKGRVLTVEADVSHMFVPLPKKVTLAGHRADIVSRDFLRKQAEPTVRKAFSEKYEADTAKPLPAAIDTFFTRVKKRDLIYRTYLTTAGRYRRHILDSQAHNAVKGGLLDRTLPHFIWVTELIDPAVSPTGPDGAFETLGHLVVNASSSSMDPDSDLLIAHTPNLITHRNLTLKQNRLIPLPFEESSEVLEDDGPYFGRVRAIT